jgi:hypothetical protein
VLADVNADFRGPGALLALVLVVAGYVVGQWLRSRADVKRAELERQRLELERRRRDAERPPRGQC